MFVLRKLTEKAQQAASAVSGVVSSATNAATSAASSAANAASTAAEAATSGIKNLGFDKHAVKDRIDTSDEYDDVATEKTFIAAIEDADVSVFMEMLLNKDELDLDINRIKDANGLTPLRLAITKGYSGIVGQLLKHGAHIGDALLRAVDVGFLETIKVICDYADSMKLDVKKRRILDCQCEDDDYHPDVTPIVLAAQQNDFAIVKVLTEAGCKIISVKRRGLGKRKSISVSSMANDDLQKSVGSLEVYKGLSSEAYLIQGNEDPIEAGFKLSKKLRELGQKDVEYKSRYEEFADNVDKVGTELISYTRSTEEILSVLAYSDRSATDALVNGDRSLPKISKAIYHQQKRFVAHPNCQQAVLAKFYGKQAFLRDHSLIYKCFYLISLILGFPFLSLVYLYLPFQKARNFVQSPYIKFTLKLASDVYFIVLLSLDVIIYQKISSNDLALKTPTKALLTVWVAGIAYRNFKVIYKHGVQILREFSQWRDIVLVTFFILGILLDSVSYLGYIESLESEDARAELKRDLSLDNQMDWININISPPNNLIKVSEQQQSGVLHRIPRAVKVRPDSNNNQDSDVVIYANEEFQIFASHEWYHPKLLSTGLFALSTVLSFLRMLQYVVISDVLGPFQISLGTMVAKTANFFVVVAIVLLSFAVGLTSLYAYYVNINSLTCADSSDVVCIKDRFSNIFNTFLYLFWSLMGVEDENPLLLDDQAIIIQEAGILLYALFLMFVVLILLNALIAVMSEAYNNVEANADIEWKFHSTSMWMSILLDDDVMPPPFNLLPSIHGMKEYLQFTEHAEVERILEENKRRNLRNKQQYQRVLNKLVERFVKAKVTDEISVNQEITTTDILGLKNDIQIIKLEIFQRLFESTYHVNQSASEGKALQNICEKTDQILARATDAYEDINCNLVPLVEDFKKHVLTKYMEIKQIEKQISNPGLFERFIEKIVTNRVQNQTSAPKSDEDNSNQDISNTGVATDGAEENTTINQKTDVGSKILQPQNDESEKATGNDDFLERQNTDSLTEKHTNAVDLITDNPDVGSTPLSSPTDSDLGFTAMFSNFLMSSISGANSGATKATVSDVYKRIEEADMKGNGLEDESLESWDSISINAGEKSYQYNTRVEPALSPEPEPAGNNYTEANVQDERKKGFKKVKKLKFLKLSNGPKIPEKKLTMMNDGNKDDDISDIKSKHSEISTPDLGQEACAEADRARDSFPDIPANSKGKKTKGLVRVSFSEDGLASSRRKKSKKGLISKVKHLNKRSDKASKVSFTKKNHREHAKEGSSKESINAKEKEEIAEYGSNIKG